MTKKFIFVLALSILSISPLHSEKGKAAGVTGDAVLEYQCNAIDLSTRKHLENEQARLGHAHHIPNHSMSPHAYYAHLVRLHIIDRIPSAEDQKKSPPPTSSEANTIITCLQQLEEQHHANKIELKVLNLMHKKVQTLDKSKAKKFIKELQKLVTKTLEKASTAGQ